MYELKAKDCDTNKKCPKCKKQNFDLTVISEEGTFSEVREGKLTFYGQCSIPEPICATAKCVSCGHSWRFRDPYIGIGES